MKVKEILEKWDEQASNDLKKTGMFNGKTVIQLQHELAALKKAGPHPEHSAGFSKIKELEFAIRAKKAKKDKWAGVDTEKTDDNKPTEVMEHSMLERFTYKEACEIAHEIAASRGEVADLHTVRIAYDQAQKACKHYGVDPLTHMHQYFVHYYNNGYPKDHGFDGHLGMHDSLG